MRARVFAAGLALALCCAVPGVRAKAPPLPAPEPVQVVRNLSYGGDPQQRIDAYVPMQPTGPVLVMVHGGAWARGDKNSAATIRPKVAYWAARGYVVVSVNHRLLPAANPLEQAQDVARALALVQQKAASWGADGRQVVLMGHSSGGHLVTLLNAAPSLAYAQGARPWRATVNLDGAAFDVVSLMKRPHARLYDRAFGRDPAFWEAVSPQHVLERTPPPPPLLVVCSRLAGRACEEAAAYERKASLLRHSMTIWTQPLDHLDIDRRLGQPGPYTESVARWIGGIL